jgi:hypothetical protein
VPDDVRLSGPLPSGIVGLTMGDVERSLRDLGLWGFPRRFGVPHGRVISTPTAFANWWGQYWGKTVPMYAGHNAFSVTEEGRLSFDRLLFRTAFGDFDNGNGSGLSHREVWEEVQAVSKWLVDRSIPHAWKCSGGKLLDDELDQGFHLRVFFDEQPQDRAYLARWESAFWRGLRHELNLKSLNIQCANPVHQERLPFTPHVHRKDPTVKGEYIFDGTYCVPIPWSWVHDGKAGSIRELSISPQVLPTVRFEGTTTPLEAFVRTMGWSTFGHEPGVLHPYPELAPLGGQAFEWNRIYVPDKLCLQVLPFDANPRHTVRFAWAVEILNTKVFHPKENKMIPMPLEEAVNLCDAVSEEAHWIDRNPAIIRQQLKHAHDRVHSLNDDTRYRPYSCPKLREEGLCVGARCPLFSKVFPQDYALYIASHPEFTVGVG